MLQRFSWLPCLFLLPAFCLVPASASAQRGGRPKTAWQKDKKLGQKWLRITGRFIFQRACLECHDRGAASFSRKEWKEKLAGFPSPDHPELPPFYRDLTAFFSYRHMVPDQQRRLASLRAFLTHKGSAGRRAKGQGRKPQEKIDLFPAAGSPAPPFKIKDVAGAELSLKSFKGRRNLVLVFSRADW